MNNALAILPWGDVIEDYLQDAGITLDAFCEEMSGGWLFGIVEVLKRLDWSPILIVVSSSVRKPERRVHLPTGIPIWVLPPGTGFRQARRRSPHGLASYLATPVRALARVLRQEHCRVILCQEYEYPRFDVAVALGRYLKIPVLATFQGGTWQASRIERWIRPFSMARAGRLLIGPSAEEERLSGKYARHAPISRVFNPVEIGEWTKPDPVAARLTVGLPPDARVVAWHGRIVFHQKGLDVLLQAWRKLYPIRRDAWLLLAGNGPQADLLRHALEQTPNVRWLDEFTNDRARLRNILGAADVYAFPSWYEGFPVAPLEAMATGLPVVATAIPAMNDIFPNGEMEGGRLVPVGHVDALADELKGLLDDRERRGAMGRRARARVQEAFSYQAVAAQLERVLQPYSEYAPA